eukprot:symbB.v1.2.023946.t1/scaffold2232.1/size85206/3
MGNANSCCASSTGGEKPESTVADAPVEEMESKMEEKRNADERTPQVVLRFIMQNGSSKDVIFTERPLGIDFSRGLPLTCKRLKPGMQGERNEVKVGWCVSHINGAPIPANFDETLRRLQDEVMFLPPA